MYSRKQYENHLQAVDAASSCISAAIAGSDYLGRMNPYIDDYVEIAEMFWGKCPITKKRLPEPGPDVKTVAAAFHRLVAGTQVGGFEGNRLEATLERTRRKLKGRLLGTRLMLMDNDSKPKCDDLKNHGQPCKCKPLTLARLAQAQGLDAL